MTQWPPTYSSSLLRNENHVGPHIVDGDQTLANATHPRENKWKISNTSRKDAEIWAIFQAHLQQNGVDRSLYCREFVEFTKNDKEGLSSPLTIIQLDDEPFKATK